MPEKDLSSPEPHDEGSPLDFHVAVEQRQKVFGIFVEQLKPWLFEFGNWLFGGLIAFNLLVVATLLTVGPSHLSVLVSIAAFACALPLNILGIFLLKLIKDLDGVPLGDVMKQAFEEANITNANAFLPDPEDKETQNKRRTDLGLRYSTTLVTLSSVLTILGLLAALWYMAWWVAVTFLVTVAITFYVAWRAIVGLMPPESEAEKEMKRRYQEQRAQQSKKPRKTR